VTPTTVNQKGTIMVGSEQRLARGETTRRLRPKGSLVWVAGFASLAWLLLAQSSAVASKIAFAPIRFHFKIDPNTPLKDLLPVPPGVAPPMPPWLVKDLTKVPEILFQKPPLVKPEENTGKSQELTVEMAERLRKAHEQAMEKTAHVIAKINHLNQKGTDHFLKVLVEKRPDLAGLPLVMGDACRLSKDRSQAFVQGVALVRNAMASDLEGKILSKVEVAEKFWKSYQSPARAGQKTSEKPAPEQENTPARIAALMQMLAPESAELRQGLVEHLAGIDHADATRALTRLALFSFEEEVRRPALAALKTRPADDCTDLLLAGLRYPWPAVAHHASEAMVTFQRKDLVSQLVSFLDEPDPRAPVVGEVDGQKVPVVRELVRLNHHHNCLLCHAPGNTPDVASNRLGRSTEIVTGAVPTPGHAMPSPSQGYDPLASPDILVRADVTYLRQDFSLRQPVKDAAPWPELQRFDFLVRTRTLTAKEAEAYRQWRDQQGTDYQSPHHQAALAALRALTGRDAPAPTAQAWRRLLGM
jgi:hypothetical protein